MAGGELPALYRRLGARVKELREGARLTQQQLAERVEVDPSYIVKIEAGRRRIQLETLEEIAAVFRCGLADFFPPVALPPPRPLLVSRAGESRTRAKPGPSTADLQELFDHARGLDPEALRSLIFIAGRLVRGRR